MLRANVMDMGSNSASTVGYWDEEKTRPGEDGRRGGFRQAKRQKKEDAQRKKDQQAGITSAQVEKLIGGYSNDPVTLSHLPYLTIMIVSMFYLLGAVCILIVFKPSTVSLIVLGLGTVGVYNQFPIPKP